MVVPALVCSFPGSMWSYADQGAESGEESEKFTGEPPAGSTRRQVSCLRQAVDDLTKGMGPSAANAGSSTRTRPRRTLGPGPISPNEQRRHPSRPTARRMEAVEAVARTPQDGSLRTQGRRRATQRVRAGAGRRR